MGERQLPPIAMVLWKIRLTLLLVVAAFLCGVLFVFSVRVAVGFGILALLFYAVVMLLYFPKFYKSYFYSFTDDLICIEKGLLLRRNVRVQTNRVQYCVLIQGPLQKLFRLTSVLICTAGSREYIRDLSVKSAEDIRKALVRSE